MMFTQTPVTPIVVAKSSNSAQPTSEYVEYKSICLDNSYTIREDYKHIVLIRKVKSGQEKEIDLSESEFSKVYFAGQTTYIGRFIFHCSSALPKAYKKSSFGFVFYGYKIEPADATPVLVRGTMDFDDDMKAVSSQPLQPFTSGNVFSNYRAMRGEGMITKPLD